MRSLFAVYRFSGAVSFVGTRLCCLGYDQQNGGGPLMTPAEFTRLYQAMTGEPLWG